MVKNYFINLAKLFKDSAVFFVQNFKKYNLLILLLIFVQIFLAIPLLYFTKQFGFSEFPMVYKILSVIAGLLYFATFLFMYKKVFNLAALGLNKEKITNARIIKALLSLGILNCTPLLAFLICYSAALLIPNSAGIMKIVLNIFTYVFYFAMCLSVSSVVFWQDKNVFVAILKSVKVFFKKILYSVPIFSVLYLVATLVLFLFCSIIYTIAIKFGFINENLINSVHAVVNLYSLYVFAGFYIGAQVKLLEGNND